MDSGKLLLGVTGGLVVLAVVVVGFVMAGPTLLDGGPPDSVSGLSDEQMPDGVSTSGVENATATAEGHERSLEGSSYTLSLQATKTVGDASEPGFGMQQDVESDGDGRYLMTVNRSGAQSFDLVVWGNESVAVGKVIQGNQSAYQKINPSDIQEGATGSITIGDWLKAGAFEPTAVEERDGRQVVVLTAEGSARDAANVFDAESVPSFSGTATIDMEGRVRSMDVEVTYVQNGNEITQTFGMSLQGVGSTSFDKPPWVPEGLRNTGQARVSGSTAPALAR